MNTETSLNSRTITSHHHYSYHCDWNVKPQSLLCLRLIVMLECISFRVLHLHLVFLHIILFTFCLFLCAQIFHNEYNFEFDTYRSRSLKRCFHSFLNQTFNKNKFYYWTLDFENDKTLDEMRRINRKRLKMDEREKKSIENNTFLGDFLMIAFHY